MAGGVALLVCVVVIVHLLLENQTLIQRNQHLDDVLVRQSGRLTVLEDHMCVLEHAESQDLEHAGVGHLPTLPACP